MITLPRRPRGRLSDAAQIAFEVQLSTFCAHILQIQSTLDFRVSSRGWCYLLENDAIITKGEFDAAQDVINDCRKSGRLPLDICVEDGAREWIGLEAIDEAAPGDEYARWMRTLGIWAKEYTPVSFWDDKEVYLQLMVEKIDLRELFAPVCRRWRVPVANARGWCDINSRAAMMARFKEHEEAGRQCVLLYCGDHDPGGLSISDFLISNLADLSSAVNWRPHNLIVDRFGLNYEFIRANGLSWIDNLETASGKRLDDPRHPDHKRPYVQNYLQQFGARKVEANALVVRPDEGRQLCAQAIQRWVGDEIVLQQYEEKIAPARAELLRMVASLTKGGG